MVKQVRNSKQHNAEQRILTIKYGIYHGSVLSLLLFCIDLNPSARLSPRVSMETCSKVKQISATSSNCMPMI